MEVSGHRTEDHGYRISVTDQGIGMSLDQLSEANESLSRTPGPSASGSTGVAATGLPTRRLVRRVAEDPNDAATPQSVTDALLTERPGDGPTLLTIRSTTGIRRRWDA
ncbi:hypothetical protein BH23ACT2_BH23ACT2_04830 [soil metagenome]